MRLLASVFSLAFLAALSFATVQDDAPSADAPTEAAAGSLRIDAERGIVAVRAKVLVVDDLLEYLLVNPEGAAHESLFLTDVRGSVLNAAFVALGLAPGRNACWKPIEPAPGQSEVSDGEETHRLLPPEGTGLYLYAAWREGDETYFFRIDDLLNDLGRGRSMRRHPWVYIGSRFQVLRAGESERFMADVEGNLINISFFYEGNTLLTAALPECRSQNIWAANAWLLPPRGAEVDLFISRQRLARVPAGWEAALPVVAPPDAGGERDDG